MKKCSKCHIEKDLSEFSKRKKYKDGLEYYCKICASKCALSGLSIEFPKNYSEVRNYRYTASLDRIDSSKGYVEGNVQWVHKTINKMKWDLNEDDFIFLCENVARYRGNRIL